MGLTPGSSRTTKPDRTWDAALRGAGLTAAHPDNMWLRTHKNASASLHTAPVPFGIAGGLVPF
jgi:hypothetical protein